MTWYSSLLKSLQVYRFRYLNFQAFKRANSFPPLRWDRDGFFVLVIIGNDNHFASGGFPACIGIHDILLPGHGLAPQFCGVDSHLDVLPKIDRFEIGNMDIRYDDTNLHERLIPGKESQLDHIVDASLFEIGEMFCVIDVALRIQIPVTDFDGMVETVIAHRAI